MTLQLGVGVLIQHQGKFLIGKRRNCRGSGCWATPGGRVAWEAQEAPPRSAVREVAEETGLPIRLVMPDGSTPAAGSDGATPFLISPWYAYGYLTLWYLAEVIPDPVTGRIAAAETREPNRCDGWHWVTGHELCQLWQQARRADAEQQHWLPWPQLQGALPRLLGGVAATFRLYVNDVPDPCGPYGLPGRDVEVAAHQALMRFTHLVDHGRFPLRVRLDGPPDRGDEATALLTLTAEAHPSLLKEANR